MPDISDPFISLLPKLLPSYGLSTSARLKRLSVSENWTYLAEDDQTRLVFRVHRHGYHSDNEIRSELAWVAALCAAEIVPTARPVATLDSQALGYLQAMDRTYTVSAFAFVDGEEPKASDDLSDLYKAVGSISARLHQHAMAWRWPDTFERKRWNFDAMFGPSALWGDWRAACTTPGQLDTLTALSHQLKDCLETYSATNDRFGLIHGDLRLANLLQHGQNLSVIDFDDCGFGWFAYDFAASISFHETHDDVARWQNAWLDGYASVRPLDQEHVDILPTMIMARRLLLTAWLASRAGNDTANDFGAGFVDGTVGLARAYLD